MASSIKTSVKTTLGPIFGDISKVASCMKMQKTEISENCSTRPYTVKSYLLSPRSYQFEIRIMRRFLRSDRNGAFGSGLQVFKGTKNPCPQVTLVLGGLNLGIYR